MSFDSNLFINYWHLVGHKCEVKNDGDYLKFDSPIGDVVIFNDMGNVIAFDNKCPHRGAKFFKDDFGNQMISCPYHRWAYRNKKVIVPDRHRFIDCEIDNADLNKFKIAFCGDFLFLGIQPQFELKGQLGNVVVEILEKISTNIEKRLDFNRFDFQSYWGIAVENALEPYHVPVVHSKTLGSLNGNLDGNNVFYDKANSLTYASIGNEKLIKRLLTLRRFFDINFQHEGYMSVYIFPFTMLSSTFGYSYSMQNFFPSRNNANQTKFTSRFFTSRLSDDSKYSQILEPFFESAAVFNRKVFEEDHGICELIDRDSWSMEPLKYASSIEEQIVHFRKMCRESVKFTEKNHV